MCLQAESELAGLLVAVASLAAWQSVGLDCWWQWPALLHVPAGRVQHPGVGGSGQPRRLAVRRVSGGRCLCTPAAGGQRLPGGEEQGHQEQDGERHPQAHAPVGAQLEHDQDAGEARLGKVDGGGRRCRTRGTAPGSRRSGRRSPARSRGGLAPPAHPRDDPGRPLRGAVGPPLPSPQSC